MGHVPTPLTRYALDSTAGCDFIVIDWNTQEGDKFNIYWSLDPNVTKKTGNKISNVKPPYTHNNLIKKQKYYYIVTAENKFGESEESYEVNSTPGEYIGMSFLSLEES